MAERHGAVSDDSDKYLAERHGAVSDDCDKYVGSDPRVAPDWDGDFMKLPQRKSQRLKNYDYSQNNAYFITICTQNRLPLFGRIENSIMILNNAGLMVFNKFEEISGFYPDVIIDKFIVMPNHLHAIMLIQSGGAAQGPLPTLSEYIRRFKTLTTRMYIDCVKKGQYPPFDKRIWQRSYHDHIIRNETEYRKIWEYIDTNPLKWELDKYHI